MKAEQIIESLRKKISEFQSDVKVEKIGRVIEVGGIILGNYTAVKVGDIVKSTGKILSVPVGDALIGRTVGALGQPKDGKGPIAGKAFYPVEKIAPGVITRQSVKQPVQTGI